MIATSDAATVVAVRGCPVCDGRHVEVLQPMRFILPDGHPLTDAYNVVACVRCGFVFADTPSSQADYDRYYADSSRYADTRTSTGAGTQDWDDRRLEGTARLVSAHVPDRSARIVDIGCANGGLLKWFDRLGYRRLEGVDPSAECVSVTGRLAHVTARTGTLFDLPPESRGADCALLSHVLEHVRDVRRAIALLRDTVRDDGLVYVEVPDATRYAQCMAAPFQEFNVEHINHFSPVSLANALAGGGFTMERIGRKTIEAAPGIPYPALWAIARATERNRRAVHDIDEGLVPAMHEYVAASRDRVAELDARLDGALAGVGRIVVWGTGQTTLTLLSSTRLGSAEVVAFTDSNPVYHGRRLAGRPVVPPEKVAEVDAPILIGSLIHHRAIAARIRELGLPNQIVTLDQDHSTRRAGRSPRPE